MSELEEEELVECLTPDSKTGRAYARTDSGEEIAPEIKEESAEVEEEKFS